ncbi:hypothetical protein N7E81_07480 [Reichenbachiella carrageenanivorans]|uniref:Uncharacterized protein n=1 Tax=Reichenbachiella carrageenanivorans TaxID=2979869 RepID=A0ABY6D451_9BACT|nr:DUF6702 family protein [Reichenbachiella carrageenanivorans]UXX80939.1 hypothetical protein N7E81_07480 [Reichenbachiella carrageenanivorans]
MTYLFLLLINYISGMPLHAFYVSVANIEYDAKSKQVEISHRIFLDDLENGLTEWTGEQVDVLNPTTPEQLDEIIGKYLNAKTSYQVDGKSVTAQYLGSEKDDGVMYCYQVISSVKKLKSLTVTNTILMEIFDDQTNIIHMKKVGDTKSLKLNNKERSGTIVFD